MTRMLLHTNQINYDPLIPTEGRHKNVKGNEEMTQSLVYDKMFF